MSLIRLAKTDLGVVSLGRYASGEVMPEHAHPGAVVSVVLAGGVMERVGRREEEGGPFSVVVKPTDVAHENRFGRSGALMLSVNLTTATLQDLPDWRKGGAGWRWHHAPEGTASAVRLGLDALAIASNKAIVTDETAIADAIAALLGAASADPGPMPPWLIRVRERLHDSWRDAPSVSTLAAEADVHRVYLARRFRQHFGTTVTAYLRSLRVQAAASALATSDIPLAQVALDSGFSDQSHLSRSFRRATRLTPRDYRQRLR